MPNTTVDEILWEFCEKRGYTAEWEARGRELGRQMAWGEAVCKLQMHGMAPAQIAKFLELPLETVFNFFKGHSFWRPEDGGNPEAAFEILAQGIREQCDFMANLIIRGLRKDLVKSWEEGWKEVMCRMYEAGPVPAPGAIYGRPLASDIIYSAIYTNHTAI